MSFLESELLETLTRYEIPWGGWVKSAPEELLNEIKKESCYLRIDNSGLEKVSEWVSFSVKNAILPDIGYLLLVNQELPFGSQQPLMPNLPRHPSGKMLRNETPREALLRIAQEKLGVSRWDYYQTDYREAFLEIETETIYPGLRSFRLMHKFDVVVVNGAAICSKQEFSVTINKGVRQLYRWVKR
jgi:hypothetical protein